MSGLFDLSGQVAVITGATSGLGLAMAQAFAAHGATVVVSGIDARTCGLVADTLRAAGHDAIGLPCDVTHRTALRCLVDDVLALRGRIDTLVCNAGVQGPAGPLAQSSDIDWEEVMTVNLRSALWLTCLVLPGMAERGVGSVVLMSSIAGLRGNQAIGLYGMSKAALAQLARNLAQEWGPSGVRVNAISPGLIRTSLASGLMDNAEFMQRRLAQTPLRRVGEPHEVAGVAVMLASPAGAFITGQNLVVDGGTLISDGN
jgi:NAD(P)-dependent dehydrogenase (short-subunit alcohol dehydrogenase family)